MMLVVEVSDQQLVASEAVIATSVRQSLPRPARRNYQAILQVYHSQVRSKLSSGWFMNKSPLRDNEPEIKTFFRSFIERNKTTHNTECLLWRCNNLGQKYQRWKTLQRFPLDKFIILAGKHLKT